MNEPGGTDHQVPIFPVARLLDDYLSFIDRYLIFFPLACFGVMTFPLLSPLISHSLCTTTLFSTFFGAGNLISSHFISYIVYRRAGQEWGLVFVGLESGELAN